MAKVVITETLEKEINKTFKRESIKIFELLYSLQDNPKKGDNITSVGDILLKEIRYKNYRFYFITDGFKLKFLKLDELSDLLIKFIRMSDKTNQQKVIDDIKRVLKTLGSKGF